MIHFRELSKRCLPFLQLLAAWLFLCNVAAAGPAPVEIIGSELNGQVLGDKLQLAELPAEVASKPFDAASWAEQLPWLDADNRVPNLGFNDHLFAGRFRLSNRTDAPLDVTIELEFPLLDQLEFYAIHEGKIVATELTGDHRPTSQRAIVHRNFLFPLSLPAKDSVDIFFKVGGRDAIQLPIKLWTTPAFIEHESTELLILGAYLGIMVAMFGYNLFLWLTIRQHSYLFYILYVASLAWALSSQKGLSTLFLFPDNIYWNEIQVPISVLFSALFAMMFTYSFLRIDQHFPRINQIIRLMIGAMCVIVALGFFVPYQVTIFLSIFTTLVAIVFVAVVALLASARGVLSARIYLLGWGGLLLGTILMMLARIDIIPTNTWTENAIFIGSSVEVILFSLGLANRFNEEKRRRVRAQRDALEKERLINIKNQKLQELELKQKEKELEQRTAELEAQRERDNLTVAIAHELRTPLNIINATLASLDKDVSYEVLAEGVDTIRSGATRLTSQTENVILMSDLSRGIQPCNQAFWVEHLVGDVQNIANTYLAKKNIDFTIEGEGNIPQRLRGDLYLITRMVAPLIDNACKYTQEGSIQVGFDYVEDHLRISIRDTGPGLPVDKRDSIYKPFAQVSSGYSRRYEGMGLGLSVASALAVVMGGNLSLDESAKQGCHFTISLPLPRVDKANGHAPSRAFDKVTSGKNQRILIVEDNEVNAKVLAKLCENLGYETLIESDGLRGLEAARSQAFGVILMDLQMPVMDGFEATEKLREQDVNVPVIAVSANADPRSRQRCYDVGMNDFISKPVKKQMLGALLSEYMGVATSKQAP